MWTALVCELNFISVSKRPIKHHNGVSYRGHIMIRNAYDDDVNKLQMKILARILYMEGRSAIYIILMYQGARRHLRVRCCLCPFSAPHLHQTRASPRKRKYLLIA